MKKNELMNGDIVVLRSGLVAVVIGHGAEAYLLFKENGFEFLDDYYDDDLVYEGDDDAIMQVFRSNGGFGFEGIDEEIPIYERDDTWVRPTEEEMAKAKEEARAKYEAHAAEHQAQADESRKELISIISQAFYGNRTGTWIRPDEVDRFVLGHLDNYPFNDPIDRTIIHLPNSEKLVLIYNKHKEEEWLDKKARALKEDSYVIKPLATIPEMNLEIYSRCIVCRMNTNGQLESLEDGDFEIWGRYLAH